MNNIIKIISGSGIDIDNSLRFIENDLRISVISEEVEGLSIGAFRYVAEINFVDINGKNLTYDANNDIFTGVSDYQVIYTIIKHVCEYLKISHIVLDPYNIIITLINGIALVDMVYYFKPSKFKLITKEKLSYSKTLYRYELSDESNVNWNKKLMLILVCDDKTHTVSYMNTITVEDDKNGE